MEAQGGGRGIGYPGEFIVALYPELSVKLVELSYSGLIWLEIMTSWLAAGNGKSTTGTKPPKEKLPQFWRLR